MGTGPRFGKVGGPFVGPLAQGSSSSPSTVPTWLPAIHLTHAALQAAALTNNIELYSLPSKTMLYGVKVKHSIAFAGTGITGYLLTVGVTGQLDRWISEYDVFQAVLDDCAQAAVQEELYSFASPTSIRLGARAIGANLSLSTAGAVDIWLQTAKLP